MELFYVGACAPPEASIYDQETYKRKKHLKPYIAYNNERARSQATTRTCRWGQGTTAEDTPPPSRSHNATHNHKPTTAVPWIPPKHETKLPRFHHDFRCSAGSRAGAENMQGGYTPKHPRHQLSEHSQLWRFTAVAQINPASTLSTLGTACPDVAPAVAASTRAELSHESRPPLAPPRVWMTADGGA